MDEEVQPQEEQDEVSDGKIIDFNAAKGKPKKPEEPDTGNDESKLSSEEIKRLENVRNRIEEQENKLKIPTLDDLRADGFTEDQIDQYKAFREIYDHEHRWQHGAKAEKIRIGIFKKLIEGNHILTHNITGSFAAENVAPLEGDGEIEAISEIRSDGKNRLPGVLQLIYRVRAGEGNVINDGNLNTKNINITIRENGNVFMLLNEKNEKDEVVVSRVFNSDNATIAGNRDMGQDEAMDIIGHVVEEYRNSSDAQTLEKAA